MNAINERKREFCCAECGLIWFDIMSFEKIITCPECNNNNLYACDTFDYIYRNIKSELRKKINNFIMLKTILIIIIKGE